ncbi:ATP-dependent zinc metalloprotease FtsH [Acetivibrio saccincola]|uniref:ATP-dependent zinc metalloprotease FtsH n=1 Tax=Acetivibrio saccincola TaxID=1677857 RepID=A0A2K9ELC7_9FIRM|nr:ATP-dependent zinc metalloprotease FtsH [Acetivibrio saccincola]AUG56240.1 ATP-dependent zinc metalloprotease FtsH [Acetivibrio saccincola]NLW26116.1 ATP-dependent zinc metalloprotease FtsH [Acetivibrio saccincola]HOA96436.1 ATP-dependent zinc metalloprotease FtsH [Acetivibrio saccincola]HQD28101.1 ATP-dependent zinc metalloprotease FtsH [Acetivibrio saccincola]
MKHFKNMSFYIVLLIILMLVLIFFQSGGKPDDMYYSELLMQIKNGNVEKIELEGNAATVLLKGEGPNRTRTVYIPDVHLFSLQVEEYYTQEGGFVYIFKEPSTPPWWVAMIPTLGLIVIVVLFWIFFLQQSQGGGGNRVMSFGKSRAKMTIDDKKKVNFNDVAGAKEEKEELQEIVEFLKNPKKFVELGARIPKGVLLVGPPGTGKTLLAKAVSGEAGVPFFSISGSDFVEMFVGVGASRVRDLFEQAKKNSPCIIFIDEIDAVGRHRGAGLGGGHDEREQTLNQLLVEMDGFGVNEGVIILAATNRPDILDPALLRPGRFDRRVVVGLPDIKGREEILRVHARGKPLSEDVRLDELAKSTPGFTGADLENLLNEAALLAARAEKTKITMEEIKEAVFKVVVGPEKKSRVMSDKEKRLTAYHEAGHAMAVKYVSTTDRVDRISIIPSGMAGGYTAHKPDEDKNYNTKSHLLEKITVALGGRAAEQLVLGEISTGAYQDLKMANGVARSMITKYGMSDNLKNLVFGNESDEVFIGRDFAQTRNYSEEIAAQIDKEVKHIIDTCYEKIMKILKDNINTLHAVANALIEKEKIDGQEFEEIISSTT